MPSFILRLGFLGEQIKEIMYVIRESYVKTNKPHNCSSCGRRFEKRTPMRRQVFIYDGICTVYSCETCDKLLTKYPDLFFDDILGMFEEFCVSELLKRGQTPEDLLSTLQDN